jgi:hypothetical protein
VGPEEIGHVPRETTAEYGEAVRPDRVRALTLAQLQLERARANFGREARGCTIQEVEAAQQAARKLLAELEIPLATLPKLDHGQLELIVDTFLEHEEGKQG